LRAELYGPIMLAFGQYVVPGNQLLLWPDRGTRVPANAEPRSGVRVGPGRRVPGRGAGGWLVAGCVAGGWR